MDKEEKSLLTNENILLIICTAIIAVIGLIQIPKCNGNKECLSFLGAMTFPILMLIFMKKN